VKTLAIRLRWWLGMRAVRRNVALALHEAEQREINDEIEEALQ